MINAISILYLSLIIFFFKDWHSYQIYIAVAMLAVFAFSIFQKYIIFIKNKNILSQIKNHLITITAYLVMFINVFISIEYLLTNNKILFIIFIFIFGLELFFIEIYNILKYNTFGRIYLLLTIVSFTLSIILFIKVIILMQYSLAIYGITVFYILLNEYISKKCYYWEHKKILFNLIDILVQQKKIDVVFAKATTQMVSENYLLTECSHVMRSSFIRINTLNSIVAYFTKQLYKSDLNKKNVLKYSSDFCILLMQKLMNRVFDYTVAPTFIVEPVQEIIRWKHFLKNKSV